MVAELLVDQRVWINGHSFVEIVIWRVPQPVRGSTHSFKYRLAFVIDDICVLRYDNEVGKGDHRHRGSVEDAYTFSTLEKLQVDFWADVQTWRR